MHVLLLTLIGVQWVQCASDFLGIDVNDLCRDEPHLELCQKRRRVLEGGSRGKGGGRGRGTRPSLRDQVYPILTAKDENYCPRMKSVFAWTCQPSKSLRLDLVEFCKDYSHICNVPNFHRLPGPRLGGANPNGYGVGYDGSGNGGPGRVGVSGNFNFGLGVVPGMEVDVGWGVDVGPIPGMGEPVNVNTGFGVGVGASSQPEAYRRGMTPEKTAPTLAG